MFTQNGRNAIVVTEHDFYNLMVRLFHWANQVEVEIDEVVLPSFENEFLDGITEQKVSCDGRKEKELKDGDEQMKNN